MPRKENEKKKKRILNKAIFKCLFGFLLVLGLLAQLNVQNAWALQNNGSQNKICDVNGYRITASNTIEIILDKGAGCVPDPGQFKLYEGVGTAGNQLTVTAVGTGADTAKTVLTDYINNKGFNSPNGTSFQLTAGQNFVAGKTYTVVMSQTVIMAGTGFTLGHTNSNQDYSFSFTCPDTLAAGSNSASTYISNVTPTIDFKPANNATNVSLEGNVFFTTSVPASNYADVVNGMVLKKDGVTVNFADYTLSVTTSAAIASTYACYKPIYNDDHNSFSLPLTQGTSGFWDFNWQPGSTYELSIPAITCINGKTIPAQTLTFTTMSGDVPDRMLTCPQVAATVSGTNATFSWNAVAAGPNPSTGDAGNTGWPAADSYNVYVSTNPYWNFTKLNSSPITGTTYTADVSGLKTDTPYYVRVSALAGGFEGGLYGQVASNAPTVVSFVTASVQTATPAITGTPTAGNTSVSGTAVAGASIVLSINGTAQPAVTADGSGNWTVTGLALASGDAISVTAQATGGTVSYAATVTVTAAAAPGQINPGGIVTTATPPTITASWSNNTAGGPVSITFNDNSVWRAAISSITVDGKALTSSQYTVNAGSITVNSGVIQTGGGTGGNSITVKASGYTDASTTLTGQNVKGTLLDFTPAATVINESDTQISYKYSQPVDYNNVQFVWYFSHGFFQTFENNLKNYVKFYNKETGEPVVLPNKVTVPISNGYMEITDWWFKQIQLHAPLGLTLKSTKLQPSTTYVIEIDAGFAFNNGDTTDKTYSFEFTTAANSTTVANTTTQPSSQKPVSTATTVALGGDNTIYNQAAFAALDKATSQQTQNAQLSADAPLVSPTATTPVTLTTPDGVQLVAPPGAVSNQTAPAQITVALGTVKTSPQAEKTAVVLNPLKYERQFGIKGQAEGTVQFTAPVTVTFPITLSDLPTGITAQQLAIYWWNPERNDWVKLGGVFDSTTNTISVPTYHFSTYAVMADTSSNPNRLSGTDRFATANAVAEQGWKSGADNVVLANAYSFPDALAAAPLAYKLNAPILLTDPDVLTPSTLAEINKLAPKKITLIGGTGAISQSIQDSLCATYGSDNVIRYGGSNRYATAVAIANALGTTGKAVIANGEDGHFPDALAVSSYAAYNGIPILFTETSSLPAVTAQALTDQKVKATIVAGGEGVIPVAIYNQLPGASRYGGTNRYETATTIATGLHLNLNKVYLVTGLDFPDALVAGNLAAHSLSPLIMVDAEMPEATATFIINNKSAISELAAIGGEGVVTPSQVSAIGEELSRKGN